MCAFRFDYAKVTLSQRQDKIKQIRVIGDLKLIDPQARGCTGVDCVPYDQIMNISDAIQGIFEYDRGLEV